MDNIEELSRLFARLPGIGPRQSKRFVYYLLSAPQIDRIKMASLISSLQENVHQCTECMRFYTSQNKNSCIYCLDNRRDNSLLMLVEKDQDLSAIERAGTYNGRYFVLGGSLTLSGKGQIREKELLNVLEKRIENNLKEVVLALSATSEGEHTADYIRDLLAQYRDKIKISTLGRGLSTGSELEYSDAETLRAALASRH